MLYNLKKASELLTTLKKASELYNLIQLLWTNTTLERNFSFDHLPKLYFGFKKASDLLYNLEER